MLSSTQPCSILMKLIIDLFLFQVSERENRPVEANGSAAAVAAMISAGVVSEAKRKHHDDQVEPFKDVKRVS